MPKKYSINLEDDEVVSVDVDGVTYGSPDEIPDPQDREQVERLIARMADGAGDDGFDADFEKEFAAELEEMRRGSARFPWLFAGIFGLIALICLAISVISGVNAARTMAREASAPGEVIRLVERSSHDIKTGKVTVYSDPVVEFAPEGEPARTVQVYEGSFPPAYFPGDRVTILYEPQQPNNVRIQSASSNLLLWLLPGITGLVGIAFAGAAVGVLKMMSLSKAAALAA